MRSPNDVRLRRNSVDGLRLTSLTRVWRFDRNRKCRLWRRRGVSRGAWRGFRFGQKVARDFSLQNGVGLSSLARVVWEWRPIWRAELTQLQTRVDRERKSLERRRLCVWIRLDLLFRPSGGSILSDDRSGAEDSMKNGRYFLLRRLEVPDIELVHCSGYIRAWWFLRTGLTTVDMLIYVLNSLWK